MTERDQAIAQAAQRHGLSQQAVQTLWHALAAGRGAQAQFDHPGLGGMGQWSGGMVQIGDMFNTGLRASVAAACAELAPLAADEARRGAIPAESVAEPETSPWWPAHLGRPSSRGAQNDTRYAFFPDRRRLAVEQKGAVTVYDTGEHRLSGFSQRQNTCSALAFNSQFGPVMLDALPVVER